MIKNNIEELKHFRKRFNLNIEPSARNEYHKNLQNRNDYPTELRNRSEKFKL